MVYRTFYFENDLRKRERNIGFMMFYILDYYFPRKKIRRLVILIIGTWKIPPWKIAPYPNPNPNPYSQEIC